MFLKVHISALADAHKVDMRFLVAAFVAAAAACEAVTEAICLWHFALVPAPSSTSSAEHTGLIAPCQSQGNRTSRYAHMRKRICHHSFIHTAAQTHASAESLANLKKSKRGEGSPRGWVVVPRTPWSVDVRITVIYALRVGSRDITRFKAAFTLNFQRDGAQ